MGAKDYEQTVADVGCRIGISRQALRCNYGRHKIGLCSGRCKYKRGCWETGIAHGRPETGFQEKSTWDKSQNRALREIVVCTGTSPTGRMCHECPSCLTLLRQNIFFPDSKLTIIGRTSLITFFKLPDLTFYNCSYMRIIIRILKCNCKYLIRCKINSTYSFIKI